MEPSGHAANTRNQLGLRGDRHDTGRRTDNVHHVAFPHPRANRIPMRIERADGDRDACAKAQLGRPLRRQPPGDLVAGGVAASQFVVDALEQRVHGSQELLRRQSSQRLVPHPLVAHGAGRARHLIDVRDPAQHRRNHVAVFEDGDQLTALVRVVPQPVQELRETPLRGVHAAAPFDRFQLSCVRRLGDQGRLTPGPVVAPQVVVIERPEALPQRDDAGTRGVQRDGLHLAAVHAGRCESLLHGLGERPHVIRVTLCGVIRIVSLPLERILGQPRAQSSALAVKNRDADAQRPEVHSRDNRHGSLLFVVVDVPAQVLRGRFVHRRRRALVQVRRHVVLEAVLADVAQQAPASWQSQPRPRLRRCRADRS